MKILKNILKSELNIRTQMNFPIEGIEFIDINPLMMDITAALFFIGITSLTMVTQKSKNSHMVFL